MSMKRQGFTLGEVVITMATIGVIVALTLPLLLGDIAAKHRMVKLQNTIGDLSNAIQTYMINKRINHLADNPEDLDFRNLLNCKFDNKEKKCVEISEYDHKNMNGGDASESLKASFQNDMLVLDNGVMISRQNSQNAYSIFIDINGQEPPNTVGLDAFVVNVYFEDQRDSDDNITAHAGEIVGYLSTENKTDATLKTECKGGNGLACYTLAEKNGFDPDYINK